MFFVLGTVGLSTSILLTRDQRDSSLHGFSRSFSTCLHPTSSLLLLLHHLGQQHLIPEPLHVPFQLFEEHVGGFWDVILPQAIVLRSFGIGVRRVAIRVEALGVRDDLIVAVAPLRKPHLDLDRQGIDGWRILQLSAGAAKPQIFSVEVNQRRNRLRDGAEVLGRLADRIVRPPDVSEVVRSLRAVFALVRVLYDVQQLHAQLVVELVGVADALRRILEPKVLEHYERT
mmetsp:Transcript_3092/g.12436  ORF Transcript_3092/g.12436 Transcript_3092/m.12436 type:complete len:229 (+) Transcript_3092:3794-4480(+)|eukprot:scaffold1311_cov256-Pinguiococcus_pyrenoidosus.AAC.37